jgi:hypothetical protein
MSLGNVTLDLELAGIRQNPPDFRVFDDLGLRETVSH